MDGHPFRRDPWAWTGVTCAAAFLILAWMVGAWGGLAFDDPVTAFVRGLPVPTGFWEACTFIGGAILIPIGVLLVLADLGSGRVRLAVICAAVLIGAALFTDGLKDLIARPRPPGVALAPTVGFSFPSGHTLNSTVTYGLIALVAWRSRLSIAVRRLLVGVGLVVPFLVGLSRIALGVHYPSDVLAGWLGGIAFVALGACLIRASGAMERDRAPRVAGVPMTETLQEERAAGDP
jgi:undecaprenyl-diphosphatase